MVRLGPYHRQHFSTQLVDVRAGQLLDVVPGRGSAEPMGWLAEQGRAFRDRIEFGTLDLSGPYRHVFEVMVPNATLVADPFHVTKLANTKLDECRRRVQNETLGHRGRKSDPLYRCRRLLTKAKERLDDKGSEKLKGLLRAGDPNGDVATCWEAKEAVRESYAHADADVALEWVTQLGHDLQDKDYPDRGPLARPHADPLAPPDRRLAPGPRQQRTHRGGQQLDQAGEACRLRLHVLPELPDPLTALRRQAQLGSAGNGHSPLISEEPEVVDRHERRRHPGRLGGGRRQHQRLQAACSHRRRRRRPWPASSMSAPSASTAATTSPSSKRRSMTARSTTSSRPVDLGEVRQAQEAPHRPRATLAGRADQLLADQLRATPAQHRPEAGSSARSARPGGRVLITAKPIDWRNRWSPGCVPIR